MTNARGVAAIGLDIGGTRLRAARVRDGVIESHGTAASVADPQEVLARCVALINQVRNDDVVALGVGIPGRVYGQRRTVLSGGFVNLAGFDFAEKLTDITSLPVVLENDAAMALIAETHFGAAKGLENVVMLTIGTGIGGAILDRGTLARGQGTAGQLGHIITNPGGRPCLCGRIGCVETESSGTAFGTHVREAGLPANTRVEDLIGREDETAVNVLCAWATPMRRAIETLIAVNNPDCVLIGGGAGPAAIDALATVPAPKSWYSAPVIAASLGDDAGVIGAATAALQKREKAKRLVLVNGVPASGKSRVAETLSKENGWPLLALDTIKAPFLRELPPGDRLFNRVLGRASYAAMFDTIAAAPGGTTFVLDAWFGFQPLELLTDGLARTGATSVVEVWCHAPPETIGERYGSRSEERGPGHPGKEYVPELIELATRAKPTGVAPVLRVETTTPLNVQDLQGWIKATL